MLAAAAMGMAIGLSFVWTFAVFTATSWIAFPRFVLATVFLFLLPGWQIVRLCRLQLSTVECVTLSAVLGIVSACFVYAVLAWLGVPSLLYWWIIAALIGLGSTWRSAAMDIRDKFLTVGPADLLLFLALIVSWIPMYVLPFYYKNLSLTGIGGLTFAPVVPDVLFHTALASELTHAFPPQIPFISGEPLSYHVGMDLVAAVLSRFGGVPIADLVVRYCPTLFITIDILAVFCLAYPLIGSRGAAVVVALLRESHGDGARPLVHESVLPPALHCRSSVGMGDCGCTLLCRSRADRAANIRACSQRADAQTDRLQGWVRRKHGQSASTQHHAKNGRGVLIRMSDLLGIPQHGRGWQPGVYLHKTAACLLPAAATLTSLQCSICAVCVA